MNRKSNYYIPKLISLTYLPLSASFSMIYRYKIQKRKKNSWQSEQLNWHNYS